MSESCSQLEKEIQDRERTIIAEVLDDTANLFLGTDLSAHDFEHGRHREIFEWILQRVEADRFHGIETAETDLNLGKTLVQSIHDHWGTPTAIQSVIDDMRQKKRVKNWFRRMSQCAGEILKTRDVDESLSMIHNAIANEDQSGTMETTRHVMRKAFAEVQEVQEGTRPGFTPTGNHALDRVAPEPGETTVIGARSSMGKSILAAALANHMAGVEKIPVLFVSLEMAHTSIVKRDFAKVAGVQTGAFRRKGSLQGEHYDRIGRYITKHQDMPLYWQRIDTPDRLIATAIKFRMQYGVRVIFLDYLQNMSLGIGERQDLREAEAIRRMDACGKKNDIAFFIMSQIRKSPPGAKEGTPRLAALSGSGAIRNTADHIWLLYRPGYGTGAPDDVLQVTVAKFRNGPTGEVIDLQFNQGVLPEWKL